jgi:predicted  nucleic acid-binding Zn-ribbon protein
LNGELTDTLKTIDDLGDDITTLEAKIVKLKADIDAINQREKDLNEARDLAEALYQAKKKRDENVITALGEIIPSLENLAQNGQAFLEKSQHDVVFALKKIPNNRPI